jgi:DNA modification methylase
MSKTRKLPPFRVATKTHGDALDKASARRSAAAENSISRSIGIELVALSELRPDPKNSRKHSRQQIRKLERDMRKNGFFNPILITQDGDVIAGHARLEAAKLAGLTEVPAIRLKLTKAEAKIRNIWDNKSSDLSHFDNGLLGLAMLELVNLDVDIEDTGFSVGECDILIQEQLDSASDPADESVPLPAGPAVSKLGDLWVCGDHRILCGDAERPSSYDKLVDGAGAHAVFTDVPYNRKARDISGKGNTGPRPFKMATGEMSPERYVEFLAGSMRLMAEHSISGALHFHCIDWRHLGDLQLAADEVYPDLLNLCVWVKPNGGMGSLYRSRHELVLVYKNGKGRHRNNVELGRHGRNRSNVWEYAGGTTLTGRVTDEGNLLNLHPTVKPVQMVADALLDCTARGDIVLDPFLGSGSTLIAAERIGRVCFGMEIDPLYVDVAIRRWQRHTGGHAVHALSGKRFDSIAGGRHG